ncbi:MAG: hypothetical protein UW22_C0002G0014 [Candidatus Gottesmanbacteria bacterium GW2011_GWB1_44_11c]|uniref:Uncharacterized protein n=2 Tax=Candidatus Gottesmaniibacteriota TaxID=1752720 RepID=A0A0G1IQR5_9BACT|nr:MAG: hypothetical protein UW22_C0002G0014 [Candidatus Gottesmanbacteria bacterium GW2011_GWB1_44_11c]KKT61500.1 MAG: hypothetical protein UW52_C0002G0014 [Candidatus Gottesmanbacteria bacterium GW2011_GWA1_44_24b]
MIYCERLKSYRKIDRLLINAPFMSALTDVLRTTDYVNVFQPVESIAQNIRILLHPEAGLFIPSHAGMV